MILMDEEITDELVKISKTLSKISKQLDERFDQLMDMLRTMKFKME